MGRIPSYLLDLILLSHTFLKNMNYENGQLYDEVKSVWSSWKFSLFYLSQDFIPKNILNTDIAPITSASYNVVNVTSWNKL